MVEFLDGVLRPLLTDSQYCTVETRGLVEQLYSGDTITFLSDYIDTASPEDRAALITVIDNGNRPL